MRVDKILERLCKDGYRMHRFTDGTLMAERDGVKHYEKNYNNLYNNIYGKYNKK